MDEHQPHGRLLVVEGTSETRYERIGCALALFFLVSGYGTLILNATGKLPWLPLGAGSVLAFAPIVTSFAALLFMRVYARRRIGKVVLYSWGLEFQKQGHVKKVLWEDL